MQHNLQLYADTERVARELHVRNIEITQKNLQLEDISKRLLNAVLRSAR